MAELLVAGTPTPPPPEPTQRRRRGRHRVIVLGVALAAGSTAAALIARPGSSGWSDGSTHGRWRAVFDGYGHTTGDDDEVTLSPQPPASGDPSDTHAALVVTRRDYADMVATIDVRTEEQLRPTQENPWEVGWVLWHYVDPQHFYGLALKPNGWELSKQDPDQPGGQRFLASGSEPQFAVGESHTVRVVQMGDTFVVSANGEVLARYRDRSDPYLRGAVGLYTEDATVRFTARSIDAVASSEGLPLAEPDAPAARS